ncbi:hypothetical protein [Vallitalea sediminicola]
MQTLCYYIHQSITMPYCANCPSYLTICCPTVGNEGYVHSESCDTYYCYYCNISTCELNETTQPNIKEEYQMNELRERITTYGLNHVNIIELASFICNIDPEHLSDIKSSHDLYSKLPQTTITSLQRKKLEGLSRQPPLQVVV